VFAVGAGGALAQVAGSPFAAGSEPAAVAFSPSMGLLSTADFSSGAVSVFAVASGGALTPVAGSPFMSGHPELAVAFSPNGALLASVGV
jgi:6-phosphogluconolactonase (cycloisomerase 2 family)